MRPRLSCGILLVEGRDDRLRGAAALKQIVVVCYESPMEEEWRIMERIRGHFLSARDEDGSPRYPQEEFLFPCAHTPGGLSDVFAGLIERGKPPAVFIINLYGASSACVPIMNQRLVAARSFLLWRARDGSLDQATDGSGELKRLVTERTGGGITCLQYGPADGAAKAHTVTRLVESALKGISGTFAAP